MNYLLVGRLVTSIVDVGPPADWVKINVRQNVCLHQTLQFYMFTLSKSSHALRELTPTLLLLFAERLLWDLCPSSRTVTWGGTCSPECTLPSFHVISVLFTSVLLKCSIFCNCGCSCPLKFVFGLSGYFLIGGNLTTHCQTFKMIICFSACFSFIWQELTFLAHDVLMHF